MTTPLIRLLATLFSSFILRTCGRVSIQVDCPNPGLKQVKQKQLKIHKGLAIGLLSLGLVVSAVASEPIEGLQRSIQQRTAPVGATYYRSSLVGFPARSDGTLPPSMPPDGFYGADLDNPGLLNFLVGDLESKVTGLAYQYASDFPEMEGTTNYMDGAIFNTAQIPRIAARISVLGSNHSMDERIKRIKTMLTMMVQAPVQVGGYVQPDAAGPAYPLMFNKSIEKLVAPGTFGRDSAYMPGAIEWQNSTWAPLPLSASQFYARVVNSNGGFGAYDYTAIGLTTGCLARDIGLTNGSIRFYIADGIWDLYGEGKTGLQEGAPVLADGRWHIVDEKSGTGCLVSKPVAPPMVPPNTKPPSFDSQLRDVHSWIVSHYAGIFTGNFKDDWAPSSCSSGCKGGGVRCATGKTGSLDFELGLGTGDYGDFTSKIRLNEKVARKNICRPESLIFSLSNHGQVIRAASSIETEALLENYSGPLPITLPDINPAAGATSLPNGRMIPVQVVTESTLAQIIVDSATKFRIQEFPAPTAAKLPDGTYPVSGTPLLRIVTIENPPSAQNATLPDLNAVRITVEDGPQTNVFLYRYLLSTDSWELIKGGGKAREILMVSPFDSLTYEHTKHRWVMDANEMPVSEELEVIHTFPWGNEVVQRIEDPSGAALTTYYYYYELPAQAGKYTHLKTKLSSTGYWETFDYDLTGRLVKQVSQLNDTALDSADNLNQVITTTYYPGPANPTRCVVETTLGAETARRYRAWFPNETRDIQCTVPGAAWDAVSNLVTATETMGGGPFQFKPKKIRHADGTVTLYDYQYVPLGRKVTISTGEPNGDAVVTGTRTITVTDIAGNEVSKDVQDIASNLSLTSSVRSLADPFGRPTQITYEDNTTESDEIGCCGPRTKTDRTGVVTSYEYDELGHVNSETRDGLAILTETDPLGRVISTKRRGTNDALPVQTLSHSRYDLAGRLAESRDALNRLTTITESTDSSGHRVVTTTYPDLSTRIETYLLDGRLFKLSGTAVHPLNYEYGVEDITPLESAPIHARFTKEIRIGTAGATTEWVKSYQDMAGRLCKTLQSNNGVSYSKFNSLGQLVKTVDPDSVTTIFHYNGRGEQDIQALAMEPKVNESINFSGKDRIVKTVRSVAVRSGTAGNIPVMRTETLQWNLDNQDASVLASTVDQAANGRHTWSTHFGLLTESETALNGGGLATTTTVFPDKSYAVENRDHGRIISAKRYAFGGAQIAAKTYFYADNFKRLSKETDARNGDSSFTYFDDDQLQSVTTPPPGDGSPAQTTKFIYNLKTGRKQNDITSEGGVVSYDYWPAGELKATSGTRTYPVEYTYDPQGRMKTLTTHGAAGAAVTTWNYHPVSGFMTSKKYHDGTGPSYMFTAGGRMATRQWVRNSITTYHHNLAGEVDGTTYSDLTPAVAFTFDRRGLLSRVIDASGTRDIEHAPDGQTGTENYTVGMFNGLSIVRGFDDLARPQTLSSTVATDVLATVYGYDQASRLQTVVANSEFSATYAYHPNSNLVAQIDFAKNQQPTMSTFKSYDALNRLGSVSTVLAAQAAASSSHAYGYNAANQRTSATLADGSSWQYGYDMLGQVTSGSRQLPGGVPIAGQQFGYQFDQIGNRISALTNGRFSSYAANLLNQYNSRTVPGTLDVIGTAKASAIVTVNSEKTTRQGNYFSAQVPADNTQAPAYKEIAVSAVDPHAGPVQADLVAQKSGREFLSKTPEVYIYDEDGNLTSDGHFSYTWDGENRLVFIETIPSVPVAARQQLTFKYDGFGRRFEKIVNAWNTATNTYVTSKTTRFLYDGWNLIRELNGANQPQNAYVWGLDLSESLQGAGGVGGLLFSTQSLGDVYGTVFDGNGNLLKLIKMSDGSVGAEYEYGPFGEPLRATGLMADKNPFRFSTKYQDAETGLLYFGCRYVDLITGRWINRDPSDESGGVNLFAFCDNQPVNNIDPTGLNTINILIALGPETARKDRGGEPSATTARPEWGLGPIKVYYMTDSPIGGGSSLIGVFQRHLSEAVTEYEKEKGKKCCSDFKIDGRYTPTVEAVKKELAGAHMKPDEFILLAHGAVMKGRRDEIINAVKNDTRESGIILNFTKKDVPGVKNHDIGRLFSLSEVFDGVYNSTIHVGSCHDAFLPNSANKTVINKIGPNREGINDFFDYFPKFRAMVKRYCDCSQ